MCNLKIRTVGLLGLCALVLLGGCGSPGDTESATSTPTKAASQAAPKTPFVPVDACTLLTKAEVEALAGATVLEPQKEELANLVTCSFGDPESPRLAGRALSTILTLAVFTGEEGAYYAGPEAQAKDTFATARRNAASAQTVSGLGEEAFWDDTLHTLHTYKGKYYLSADSDKGLDFAKSAAEKALAKLP